MELEISLQIFEKTPSNINFHENLSSGIPVVPFGRTDKQTERHDEANSNFPKFCEKRLTHEARSAFPGFKSIFHKYKVKLLLPG